MKPVPAVPPLPSRSQVARVFGAIAADFAATRTSPWPETIEFEAHLPRGSRILDIGCGNGRNLAFLRDRGHAVVGLDASEELLTFAAKVSPGNVIAGDAVLLPFRNSSFEAVHCVATLHHLPSEAERSDALREAARVLRPEGRILASVWALDRGEMHEAVDEFAPRGQRAPSDWHIPWTRSDGQVFLRFYHLFRPGELDGLVRAAGLAVTTARRVGDNHVVSAAKR